MTKIPLLVLVLALPPSLGPETARQAPGRPETVLVHSGALKLRALVWRPRGAGTFPAVMFNHGNYSTRAL
jgi:hypothetical protein